jgi:molybdopterin/thiamine biosynthesis adenylyltransferase
MLPDGELFGRVFTDEHDPVPVKSFSVAGEDINFWPQELCNRAESLTASHRQAFGERTIALLHSLKIGVVECSGTGSSLSEMLARLGAGSMVLIDPDVVEDRNLNRIFKSTAADAVMKRPKVEVLARAINAMSIGSKVTSIQKSLFTKEAARAIARCDVVFGCVDSHDGRFLLNKVAAYYSILILMWV